MSAKASDPWETGNQLGKPCGYLTSLHGENDLGNQFGDSLRNFMNTEHMTQPFSSSVFYPEEVKPYIYWKSLCMNECSSLYLPSLQTGNRRGTSIGCRLDKQICGVSNPIKGHPAMTWNVPTIHRTKGMHRHVIMLREWSQTPSCRKRKVWFYLYKIIQTKWIYNARKYMSGWPSVDWARQGGERWDVRITKWHRALSGWWFDS